jgi:PAS domain S-box-containing protein
MPKPQPAGLKLADQLIDLAGEVEALSRSHAIASFDLDGMILSANQNFLDLFGYTMAEIKGRHHRLFVEPDYAGSAAYRQFWSILHNGQFQAAEFKRIGKDGREIWLQASYNPILGRDGRPCKVMKFATDVTERKRIEALIAGQVNAIAKSQAVIEFALDGTVLHANPSYLAILGYELDEIVGRHHRMFIDPSDRETAAYGAFWDSLRKGACQAATFRRFGKDGREVWMQATYNPILDLHNEPCKVVKFATDITTLKHAETQLVTLEAQFRALGDTPDDAKLRLFESIVIHAKDAILITEAEPRDLPGPRIVYANPAFTEMTGYSAEEVIGKSPRMFQGPLTGTQAPARIKAALMAWQPSRVEIFNYRKNGEGCWVEISISPLCDKNGWYTHWISVQRDITARKRELETLRLSATRLALATDSGSIGIWDWDILRDDMLWDDWMCRLYDVVPVPRASSDTYQLWSHRLHPEDRDAAEQAVADAIAGLRPFDTSFRVVWRDGGVHHIRATGEVTRDAAGAALRMVGVNWDVTAQVEQNRALQEVTTRMMLAADAGGLGILEIDIKKNMMMADEWACRIFGIPYVPGAAVPGDIWKLRIHPDDRARCDQARHDAIDGIAPYALEYRIIRDDGAVRHLKCSGLITRDTAGEALRMTGSVQDITARMEIEEALVETASELKRSNEELDLFASIASHDLQEPLRMVASYMQLISKRYKGKLDADADEFIDYAVDGAKRMQRLLQDLLAYSRVGTKGMELRRTEAGAAFEGAIWNLQVAIEQSGAAVTHGLLPSVLADEFQLTQLFQNLVGNAIKYRNGDAPVIHVSAAPVPGGQWRFVVQDNGLGIDAQHFDRIFGMFQRLHGVGEYSGTGIGLAICKKIVDRHGGVIGVDSKPGEGSAFHFTLAGMAPDGNANSKN